MSRIWMPGGAGGADLDVVTAGAGDVLKGKVIVEPDGEPLTGTLALSGDAGDSMVLSGKTYYNTDPKQKRTGDMANQGAKTAALNCGGSYTIPAGYHNGKGKVTANSLAAQTDANAAAGDILSGKNAWVKGSKISGSMGSMNGQTLTPTKSQQTVSCSGKKMNGNIVVGAIPGDYINVKQDQKVFDNGVCNLIKRVYPYRPNLGTTLTHLKNETNYPVYYNGPNPNIYTVANYSSDPASGLLFDGSVNLTPFTKIYIELTRSATVEFNRDDMLDIYLFNANDGNKRLAYKMSVLTMNWSGDANVTIDIAALVGNPENRSNVFIVLDMRTYYSSDPNGGTHTFVIKKVILKP